MTVTIESVKQKSSNKLSPSLENIIPEDYFDPLFDAYWSKVRSLLAGLVGDDDEAEDLALEVFWRLYSRPPADIDTRDLGGWIYRVATNLGYNALRSRNRRMRYEKKAGIQYLETTDSQNPAHEAENAEQRKQVRQVLCQLKPRSAQILILRYSGLSYLEIATALGLAPTSVGTLLARAEREFEKKYRNIEKD